eukprot:34885-Chlamydomonas_euryale.AAC.2
MHACMGPLACLLAHARSRHASCMPASACCAARPRSAGHPPAMLSDPRHGPTRLMCCPTMQRRSPTCARRR